MENANFGARKLGVLVASQSGKTSAYGIGQIEDRGILFVEPNEEDEIEIQKETLPEDNSTVQATLNLLGETTEPEGEV